ncbi:GlsB/YeaQ/YmgE family stress response membrane protein [Xenorhabdus anantnagensis]|uniref:GlsB/YeaQ/YmgE family stress response membrane protein n=1 Tax=Xenorhabdus anantnagensis TaxID=3025875 RepID=A0ABT5LQ75_9GAMM|nr:GlsB/YeaQ/YmgE family stress response membrane protein [Xenorhabdus anantnagensis]MDC9596455.1 GlsB/YeaQ/YmgE family stress response membrane protein [Xenorhabdus anantnagensis]
MGILSWIIFGLLAGFLAKWIMPGDNNSSGITTMILGIVGAIGGGYISSKLFGVAKISSFNLGSLIIAVIGAMAVLFVYNKISNR